MKDKLNRIIRKINSTKWVKTGQWHTPFLIDYTLQEADKSTNLKKYGFDFGFDNSLFLDEVHYFLNTEMEAGKKYFLDKILENPEYLSYFKTLVLESTKKAENYFYPLTQVRIEQVDNDFLIDKIEEFRKVIEDLFVFVDTYVSLQEAISEYLNMKLPSNALKFIPDLIIPRGTSFVMKEKMELSEIVSKILKWPELNKIFSLPIDSIQNELKEKYPDIYNKIQDHKDKYAWMNVFNWIGEPYNLDYYIGKISELLSGGQNVKKDKQSAEELKYQQLVKAGGINNDLKLVIELARDHLEMKLYRWDIICITGYRSRPLLAKAAEKLGIELNNIWYFNFDELFESLKSGRNVDFKTMEILKEREAGYILFKDNGEITSYTGLDRKKILKKANPLGDLDFRTREIKGEVAFRSNVPISGRVRIMTSVKEVSLMQKDEILVCPMTDPDYMPAIIKAKGIVTDLGGLLCHAAIVSRELRIPCIIGTKIATKVLKDGDLVEVNANKGIVKILKRV